jgi:DNA-binding CsgD family transcriptional regulator
MDFGLKFSKNEYYTSITGTSCLISAIGTDHFYAQLYKFLHEQLDFSNSSIIRYSTVEKPERISDQEYSPARERWLTLLVEKAFVLAPYYTAIQNGIEPGFYLIQECCPDDFFQSEYFDLIYSKAKVVSEGCFLVKVDKENTYAISVERLLSDKKFSTSDIRKLKALSPLISSIVKIHWLSSNYQPTPQESLEVHFEKFLGDTGGDQLSRREQQVAFLILKGHSAKSAARELDITVNTIREYRKRLYMKLNISSHGELFSMFFS